MPEGSHVPFLTCFWCIFAILREGWFTVAIFGLFFISFLTRFYCQLFFPGSKNEVKTGPKTSQKRLKNTTVSTPNVWQVPECPGAVTWPRVSAWVTLRSHMAGYLASCPAPWPPAPFPSSSSFLSLLSITGLLGRSL